MALIVQKYGGTSVGSIEKIKKVAERILASFVRGDQVVVVVSAMSGETNRLIDLANQIDPVPFSREYDMLIASGEQVAVGLLSLAINSTAKNNKVIERRDYLARPFLGYQIGILTDQIYSKARIREIKTEVLQRELLAKKIPVIAGFQGVDPENNITTLGRGGSDTSAVAIAVAMKADDCEIYTDVDGVYTTNPSHCASARKMPVISYSEMMELSSLGAKVLQIRSVELAAKFNQKLHVRSSFFNQEGTRVVQDSQIYLKSQGRQLEQVVVAGVASDSAQVKFNVLDLPDLTDLPARIFKALSDAAIVVDIIVQAIAQNNRVHLGFTVADLDAKMSLETLENLKISSDEMILKSQIIVESNLAKISIVGAGMQHHPGVAAKMFEILAGVGAKIKLITTSEIKISCLIDEKYVKNAVESLHEGFNLQGEMHE